MATSFLQTFEEYSNVELLKIIESPNDYQVEAIQAATQILLTREVTEEDFLETRLFIEAAEAKKKEEEEKMQTLFSEVKDFFQPLLHPGAEITLNKWLNIFLCFVAVQYFFSIYSSLTALYYFYQCELCGFDILIALQLAMLPYVPLVFYLLFKRKRWGWILLFADNALVGLTYISGLVIYSFTGSVYRNAGSVLWPIFIRGFFVAFLLRDDVAEYFNISPERKMHLAKSIGGVLLAVSVVCIVAAFLSS
jgi:hypothetical protein